MKTRFVVRGVPVGKPRMTKRDKWKRRPCVLRYRAWADAARAAAGLIDKALLTHPTEVIFTAYMPIAARHRKGMRELMRGTACTVKPDRDNIDKALCDALFANDHFVFAGAQKKLWDDGHGPRVEVEIIAR